MSFSVVAKGDEPLKYQWRHNGNDIGITTCCFSVMPTPVDYSGIWTVVVSNSAGSVVSEPATVSVLLAKGWQSAASMSVARIDHTASLLPNGKVLVAGGANRGGVLASTELYDPAANSWSNASAMASARKSHSAFVLRNGKVLVVGGSNDAGGLTSAELYDPAANSWSPAGVMSESHIGHAAVLLNDGRVLVTGGYKEAGYAAHAVASAELYNPETNTWSKAAGMLHPRASHSATTLFSGKVLVAGGQVEPTYNAGAIDSAELYDPASNSWGNAARLLTERSGHSAIQLRDGEVLVVGGSKNASDSLFPNSSTVARAELYNLTVNNWRATSDLYPGSLFASATLLSNGKVLLAGGYLDTRFTAIFYASANLYDHATDRWSDPGSLAMERTGHTATLLPNGKVLVVGGLNNTDFLSSAELFGTPSDNAHNNGASSTSSVLRNYSK